MADSAPSFRRFEALDSLRGLCACAVMLFHFNATGLISGSALVRGAEFCVDFFFVLSGFVISASYGDRLRAGYPVWRFMGLRLGRVYPLHLVMLAVFVALELVALVVPILSGRAPFSGTRSLSNLLDNLLLIQSNGLFGGPSWNSPAWSIAVEVWTYLVTALIMRYAGRAMWPVLAVVMAGSVWQLAHGSKWLLDAETMGLQRCLYGFGFGMIGFALFRRGAVAGLRGVAASGTEAVLVAAALVMISCATGSAWSLLAPPLFMVFVLVFAQEGGGISRWLLRPWLRLLGTLSFAIYMVHLFVVGRLLDVLRIVSPHWGTQLVQSDGHGGKTLVAAWYIADFWALVLVALVLPLAWLAHHYVETPAREWSRRKLAVSR